MGGCSSKPVRLALVIGAIADPKEAQMAIHSLELPDLIKTANTTIHGDLHVHWVSTPKRAMPTIGELEGMTEEEITERRDYWLSACVFTYLGTVLVGTAILKPLRASGRSEEVDVRADYFYTTRASFLGHFGASVGVSYWSANAGCLSRRFGLDWDAYWALLAASCGWTLVQAAYVRSTGRKVGATAFAEASCSATMPFMSDAFDTLKDAIFGGICLMSSSAAIKGLGYFSWLWLLASHYFMFRDASIASELNASYASILYIPSTRTSLMADSFDKLVSTILKQVTPAKVKVITREDVPQAVLALIYTVFEGGSQAVLCLNIAIPLTKVLIAKLFGPCLTRLSVFWLAKQLAQAEHEEDRAKIAYIEEILLEQPTALEPMVNAINLDNLDFSDCNDGRSFFRSDPVPNHKRSSLTRFVALPLNATVIDFSKDTPPTKIFWPLFGKALETNGALTNLNLDNNRLGEAGGAAIGKALETNGALTNLNLCCNELGEAAGATIGKALETNGALTNLNLAKNELGEAAGAAIGKALETNGALTNLNLDNNQLGEAAGAAIGKALETNGALKNLNLDNNHLGEAGGAAIGKALETNGALTNLSLCCNQLGEAAGAAIGKALETNGALTRLDLHTNQLSETTTHAIEKALLRKAGSRSG